MQLAGTGLHRHDLAAPALASGAALVAGAAAVAVGPAAIGIPLALAAAALLVRFPIALYVLFVYIPIFSGEAALAALPADPTVALGLVLIAVCGQRLLTGRVRPLPWRFVLPLAAIAILLPLSLLWTAVPDYGTVKVEKFLGLSLLAAGAPFFLIEGERDIRSLLYFLAGAAATVAAITLVHTPTPEAGVVSEGDVRGRLEFGGQIFTSRMVATGALILFFMPAIVSRRNLAIAGPIAGLALVGVSLGLGSRGPLLSLGLAFAVTLVAVIVGSPRRLAPVLIAAMLAIAVFPLVELPETSTQRIGQAVEDPVRELQTDGRSPLYRQAVLLIRDEPLTGVGSGGFFLYSFVLANQEERYPHNIFLELGAELGLLPAVLLALSVAALIWGLYARAWRQPTVVQRQLVLLVAGVFLLNLFATQFSGDINDNRTFWAFFGLGWLVAFHGLERSAE